MNKLRYILLLLAILGAIAMIYYSLTRDRVPASIDFDFPLSTPVNQEFEVPLRISTSVPMNAAEFYFSFPAELIQVKEINQSGSINALWIKEQPAFNNKTGEISFAGGLPNPGFVGRNGLIATVKFTALKRGVGQVILDSAKSRILANDGLGTKIEATFDQISFTIK